MTPCRARTRRPAASCESLAAVERLGTEAAILAARAYARAEALEAALELLQERAGKLDAGQRAQSVSITLLSRNLPQAGDQPQAPASPRRLRALPGGRS